MAGVVIIEHGTDAWYDLLAAGELAAEVRKAVSISIEQNGLGETMVAFKVGEDMWTAYRTITTKTIHTRERVL